jgi:hypothetical protein
MSKEEGINIDPEKLKYLRECDEIFQEEYEMAICE